MKLEPAARVRRLESAAEGKLGKEMPLLSWSVPNCSVQDYLQLHIIVVYKKNQHLCLECHNSAHINKDSWNRES